MGASVSSGGVPLTAGNQVNTAFPVAIPGGTQKCFQGAQNSGTSGVIYTCPASTVAYVYSCFLHTMAAASAAVTLSWNNGADNYIASIQGNSSTPTNYPVNFAVPIKLTAGQTLKLFANAANGSCEVVLFEVAA